jgi:hypothetical protein
MAALRVTLAALSLLPWSRAPPRVVLRLVSDGGPDEWRTLPWTC